MDPDTSKPKFDSRKTNMLTIHVNSPTERRERIILLPSTRLTNPSIPPERWVNVIIAPIRALKMSTLALSGSPSTATMTATD